MSDMQDALQNYIRNEVEKQVNALVPNLVADAVARHFAFLAPEKKTAPQAPAAVSKAVTDKARIAARFNKPCVKCGKDKSARWMVDGVCADCQSEAKPAAPVKRTYTYKTSCSACKAERRKVNADGICNQCVKKGNGPVTVMQTNSYVALPMGKSWPKFYEDIFELFGVSRFTLEDVINYTDLSQQGALTILRGWSNQKLAKEVAFSSDAAAHTWRLTPTGLFLDPIVVRRCAEKRGFVVKDDAESTRQFYKTRGDLNDGHEVFECPYGKHYHIGSNYAKTKEDNK